jgi:P-type E1-E2 ATPase
MTIIPYYILFFLFSSNILGGVSPLEKSSKIEELQASGKKVMMIGDGINDSVALGMADVGKCSIP